MMGTVLPASANQWWMHDNSGGGRFQAARPGSISIVPASSADSRSDRLLLRLLAGRSESDFCLLSLINNVRLWFGDHSFSLRKRLLRAFPSRIGPGSNGIGPFIIRRLRSES
jgi:hypothetical protein